MPPRRILMVCLGNICRSPLAEGILQEKARAAGHQAPHHLSLKVARQHGIDISNQRARRFTAADFQRFDKIYAMAGDVIDDMRRIAARQLPFAVLGYPSKVDLLMNEVHPGSNEDVPDPWYGPEPGYHEGYAMIDQAADRIIAKYRQPTSKKA
jgi:protein-tyrosine phosphatase